MLLRTSILLLLSVLFSGFVVAESRLEPLIPSCGGTYNLCGYVGISSKDEYIPKRFEKAERFYEGLALVRSEGKYGYINRDGKFVIQPDFTLAGTFYQGIAEVVVGGKAGIINSKGDVLVQPQFARAIPFTKNVVLVREGTFSGTRLSDGEYQALGAPNNSLNIKTKLSRYGWGLFNISTGKKMLGATFFSIFEEAGRGLIWATRENIGNRKVWGLMNQSGEWILEPQFHHVQKLVEGRAVVKNIDNLWGAISSDGRVAIPFKYRWVGYSRGGYHPVSTKNAVSGLKGFVTQDGELIGGKFYDKAEFLEGLELFRFTDANEVFCFYKAQERVSCPKKQEGSLVVAGQSKTPTLASKRKELLRCKGDIHLFKENGLWGIKGPGTKITVPAKFEAISCFKHGIAWVPVREKKAWCPIGVDSELKEAPACRKEYYPIVLSHYFPEKLSDDPFKSSLLWTRAYYDYALGEIDSKPKMIGDGVMGKKGELDY